MNCVKISLQDTSIHNKFDCFPRGIASVRAIVGFCLEMDGWSDGRTETNIPPLQLCWLNSTTIKNSTSWKFSNTFLWKILSSKLTTMDSSEMVIGQFHSDPILVHSVLCMKAFKQCIAAITEMRLIGFKEVAAKMKCAHIGGQMLKHIEILIHWGRKKKWLSCHRYFRRHFLKWKCLFPRFQLIIYQHWFR